jgi:hypothetical protein
LGAGARIELRTSADGLQAEGLPLHSTYPVARHLAVHPWIRRLDRLGIAPDLQQWWRALPFAPLDLGYLRRYRISQVAVPPQSPAPRLGLNSVRLSPQNPAAQLRRRCCRKI